jgi:hypothetical protein
MHSAEPKRSRIVGWQYALSMQFALLALACSATAPVVKTPSQSCAAQAEPTALKIEPGSGITPPKAIHRVEPLAPASLAGRGAFAIVEAIIGEDGKPRHICFASGDSDWGNAVAVAFKQWLFEPATLEGKPVAVQFTLTMRLRG